MKYFLTIILLILLTCSVGSAGQAELTWAPPTTNEDGSAITDLAGYKIYVGTASKQYTKSIDVGNITGYKLSALPDGTWYFAVTAYNTAKNESAYSNEVSKVIKNIPSSPQGCTVK